MKKTNRLLYRILLLFLCITLVSPAFLPGQAAAESAAISASVANVRSGPGEAYDIVGMLAKDTMINILDRSDGWCKMQAGNVSGWINESLIASAPETSIKVTATTANLRAGEGTSFAKLGEAKLGDSLKLLGINGDWCRVQTASGLYAYINASLVEGAGTVSASSASKSGSAVKTSTTNSTSTTSTSTSTSSSRGAESENIPVYVNGSRLAFDVNPIIVDGRTLVPMRAIFEAMGASINWDGDSQTVSAQKNDTSVVLKIGSSTPSVNGKAVKLDVPARIVKSRTLVPLRFVGEALGGRVAWDPYAREVSIFSSSDPDDTVTAVIIDRDEVNLRSAASASSSLEGTAIQGQKFTVISEKDGWYKISDQGQQVWVAGWLVRPVWSASRGGTSTPAVPSSGPEVSIQLNKDSDGFRILMECAEKPDTKVSESAGCIDITFEDCRISQDAYIEQQVGNGTISVTGSNQDGNVRVHVSLPQALTYKKSSENNGKKQVIFIPNCIVGLERQTFNGSGERIIVNTALPCTYTQRQSGNEMTVTLPGVVRGLAKSSYNFKSQSMESLDIEENASSTEIKITTSGAAKFSIGSSDDETAIHILFIKKSDIPPRDSLVILDAGHGGRDIGASGDTLCESEVNLDLVRRVGALLVKKGIRVDYTRGDDGYVSLADRAATANLMNAALFVSIHNNANADRSKGGTETYYYAPMSNPNQYLQKEERENLATQIQTRLAASLGRLDRGVKTANFQVLRDTEMPSALAECVFISNPEEENLLQQENFKNSIARAIADGIAACMKGTTVQNPSL